MEADGKSMTPSVSVVICTYNHARFLHKSLQSVFAQGWPDDAYEVIVIDDGSTDATPKIMRRWVRDRGVKYIRKENGGHLSSFNRGIAEATGEYIVLHDGDDMLRPRMIGPRIELMERDPEIGLVHGDLRVVDVRGNVLVPSLFEAYRFEQLDGDLLPNWSGATSSRPAGRSSARACASSAIRSPCGRGTRRTGGSPRRSPRSPGSAACARP